MVSWVWRKNSMNPKSLMVRPSWSKRHLNESLDFNDPKEFDDPQVFHDPKGILIESMEFDNPEVYGDT